MEWAAEKTGSAAPRLEILDSPYRRVDEPILGFLDRIRREDPGRLIAVVIPEVMEPHWYEWVLHNLHARRWRGKRDWRMNLKLVEHIAVLRVQPSLPQ